MTKLTKRESDLLRRALDKATTQAEAETAARAFIDSLRKRGLDGYAFVPPDRVGPPPPQQGHEWSPPPQPEPRRRRHPRQDNPFEQPGSQAQQEAKRAAHGSEEHMKPTQPDPLVKASLVGIYLGITFAAILTLVLGALVLANHPIFWIAKWWNGPILMAIGWLVLALIGRVTRGYKAAIVGYTFGFLLLGIFIGYHWAAIAIVFAWITNDKKRAPSAPALPITKQQKIMIRIAAGYTIAGICAWLIYSFSQTLAARPAIEARLAQVPAEVIALAPEMKTDPAMVERYFADPAGFTKAVMNQPDPTPTPTPEPVWARFHWIKSRAEYDALPTGSMYYYVLPDGTHAISGDGRAVDLFSKGDRRHVNPVLWIRDRRFDGDYFLESSRRSMIPPSFVTLNSYDAPGTCL
jgi:hypothetical protein